MMKSIILGMSMMSAVSAYATETKTLICRGGSQNLMSVVTRISHPKLNTSEFHFKKAANAAGDNGQNLQPGECAFSNRALTAEEPAAIYDMKSEATLVATSKLGVQKITVESTYTTLINSVANPRYLYIDVILGGKMIDFLERDTTKSAILSNTNY